MHNKLILTISASLALCIPVSTASAQSLRKDLNKGQIRLPALSKTVASSTCSAITPAALDKYSHTIGTAVNWASKDAAQNGTSGAYAVAAKNSRDLFSRAQKSATDGAQMLRQSDPAVTTYAEAGAIKENVRAVLEVVPQATHWATVSAIYHKSTDAEKAFEQGIVILEQGNTLLAQSSRCYMAPYIAP